MGQIHNSSEKMLQASFNPFLEPNYFIAHMCIHTYIHTYIPTYMDTYIDIYIY